MSPVSSGTHRLKYLTAEVASKPWQESASRPANLQPPSGRHLSLTLTLSLSSALSHSLFLSSALTLFSALSLSLQPRSPTLDVDTTSLPLCFMRTQPIMICRIEVSICCYSSLFKHEVSSTHGLPMRYGLYLLP